MGLQRPYSLNWIYEPIEGMRGYFRKKMFSCHSAYLGDRLVLVSNDQEEPWNGILVPTSREHHESLQKEFPFLLPHPVLGKWLYLTQASDEFEGFAQRLAELICAGDPRIGVSPKPKSKRRSIR